MISTCFEQFPALAKVSGTRHAFSRRFPDLELGELDSALKQEAAAAGFQIDRSAQAAQPHGSNCAVVLNPISHPVEGADALTTNQIGLCLIVRVADCGAVYFVDPVRRAVALAHSGRIGTEQNCVETTILTMQESFGSNPTDLVVQLGPCIRRCHYEVDFAGEIEQQARAAGVIQFHDSRVCTACHLDRYYSYRAEKGRTGRMWALLQLDTP